MIFSMIKKALIYLGSIRLFRSKAVRYVFSGGTAAFVNLALTWLLYKIGMQYILVVSIAYTCSLLVTFFLQKFFTFANTDGGKAREQFVMFFIVGGINLFVNDFLVYIQFSLFRFPYLVFDQAIAIAIVAFYTFFIYRHIIFKNA